VIRDLLTTAASRFDSAVGSAVLLRRRRVQGQPDPEALGHEERIKTLAEIRAVYDAADVNGQTFFLEAQGASPRLTRVRAIGGREPGTVLDSVWPSDFEPLHPEVRDKYLEHEQNRTAGARLFLHAGRARPAIILVHGYMCGHYSLEERIWPVNWFYERGLDVALFVLPFHAIRANARSPKFPGNDPRVTNEGFRQAVLDLRSLSGFLRGRGSEAVGLMGMSLGGYTTSLLATLEENLAFAVPIIPLASIAEIARSTGRFVGTEDEQEKQFEALDAVYRHVSPFSRKSRIATDRVLVLAAEGDRITPVAHARRLAEHFGAPLETFHGGHLLQFGRADAFRAVGRMLGRLGLFSRRGD